MPCIQIDVFSGLATLCCACYQNTEGQTKYLNNLENNRLLLIRDRERLIDRKREVQELLNRGNPSPYARQWLRDAGDEENELSTILGPVGKEYPLPLKCGSCYLCCCCAYDLGRRLDQALIRVERLLKDRALEGDESSNARAMVVRLSGEVDMVGMEAKFHDFWTLFDDETTFFIGIHGMGGIGKSAFLIKINNEFLRNARARDFDKVIWIDLSADQEIKRIHDAIGERLGLSLPKQLSDRERGGIILSELNRKRFVLLLDDLRQGLVFSELGVPYPDGQNRCKVVFTTREQSMWSNIREVRELRLELLDEPNARSLFKEAVGETTLSSHRSLLESADQVADMCDGLPLTLLTIGRAMSGKTNPTYWEHTVQRLESPAPPDAGDEEKVFDHLAIGYGNLKDPKSIGESLKQKCFLYCSLFPKGQFIKKEELVHYWVGEGFMDHHQSLKSALDHGHSVIDDLEQVSLLIVDKSTVKMHSSIHGMALWVASGRGTDSTGKKFFVHFGDAMDKSTADRSAQHLVQLPETTNWSQVERISLVNTRIDVLNRIECPNLSTLILKKAKVLKIADDFFDPLNKLKVLDLAWSNLTELPRKIVKLTTLCYLNLSHSRISSLPIDIGKLKKLKFLDLSFTMNLLDTPRRTFSEFSELQFLNLYYCGYGKATVLDEARLLKHLEDLGVTIEDDQAFHKLSSSQRLNCTRILIRKCEGMTSLDLSSVMNMKSLLVLHVINCTELASFLLHQAEIRVGESFGNLSTIEIRNCSLLKDLSWVKHVQALQVLKVVSCTTLEKVISGDTNQNVVATQPAPTPLSKLRILYLDRLPELDSILVQTTLPSCMEEITVLYCPKLNTVPLHANTRETLAIACQETWWNALTDIAMKSRFNPSFRP